MSKAKFYSFASVISSIEQSDMFMTVKARMLETPKANLNGARVTGAFVDEVISNEERYVGLPLYADTRALLSGRYNSLGHLYNSKTGEFHSTQIGSFYQFEKEEFEGGAYLVGYARIPKRNKQLSKAIAELFADGALKFSFEIACGDWTELEDGTIEIDASELNYLEGMAIVSFPACEEAVALEFVAQREADDPERGVNEMAEVEKLETEQVVAEETDATNLSEQTEVQPEQVTAEEKVEDTAETKVEEKAETKEEEAEEKTEDASCKKDKEEKAEEADKETAAVYVHESTRVTETIDAYDTETGISAFQCVEVTTGKSQEVEGNLVETDSGLAVAQAGGDEGAETGNTPAENTETSETQETDSGDAGKDAPANPPEETASDTAEEDIPMVDEKKKTAEVEETHKTAEEMIAELTKTVEMLTEEIKSLKEKHVAASQKVTTAAINPFVDSITAAPKKYDLLDKVDKVDGHALLSR